MTSVLLVVGLAVAAFVGFNIGGSSTGVAFGPAVGSGVVSKLGAAVLMAAFALLGGWTVGRNVVDTMGGEIVPAELFTLGASVGVLFFVGLALLVSNLFGVPASTSMTAVGAIAGLGVAAGNVDWGVMGRIVSWWLVAPIVAFWVCAVVGRYLYPYLDVWFRIDQSEGPLLEYRRVASIPYPVPAANTNRRELVSSVLVVVIGCYMAFSAGASNVANAVAPLVGSEAISTDQGILLAGGAIALGAFTIARRTLDTVGNDLTDLPLLAALVVEVVSASLITFLSYLGIPASLAVSATMCIVGLGWGRATRVVKVRDAASAAMRGGGAVGDSAVGGDEASRRDGADGGGETSGEAADDGAGTTMSVNALTAEPDDEVQKIGEEDPAELSTGDLFDPAATGRVVVLWILTPSISAVASFLLFEFFPIYG